jgi:Nicotianamine synthase protein
MTSGLGAGATAHALRAIYEELVACEDLRPGAAVDDAFGRLVELVVGSSAGQAAEVLAHPAVSSVVPRLRALCFEGEYELERAWAQRIATSSDPGGDLGRFPYVENYRRLSAMERAVLARPFDAYRRRPPERVALVGSGPLPLTAFLLAGRGVRVDNIDSDAAALALSRRVADALGIDGMSFLNVDVGTGAAGTADAAGATDAAGAAGAAGAGVVDFAAYDLVVLAALVGLTPDGKSRVITHLATAMAPGALLLARSAHGLRTLLYPEIDMADLAPFEVLDVVHPTHEVINSVILARKPEDR